MVALEQVNASWVMTFASAFVLATCFYLNFSECNNELLYLFYQTFSQQKDPRECQKNFAKSMQRDSYIVDSHGVCQPLSTGNAELLEYEQY